MTRYSSLEEVNAALVELEEHERVVATEKTNYDKHSDNERTPSRTNSGVTLVNGQNHAHGIEENGGLHDEINPDTDSDSGSGSIVDEDDSDEGNHDEESESEEDYEDMAGPASDEEDEVHVRQVATQVDPLEAAEFDRDLRALMQESLDSRKLELRSRPTINMTIPMNVFEGSGKDHLGRFVEGESGDETTDEGAEVSKEVQVKVLVKRGHKQQMKHMYIPRDCSLVQSTKQKEAAELEEKQDIKRLVLEYNDREEEELNGLGSASQSWMQSGGSRAANRGHAWEAHGRGGAGGRHRHQHHHLHHSGAGIYYNSKRS